MGSSVYFYYGSILMSCSFGFPFSSDLLMILGGSLASIGTMQFSAVLFLSPLAILCGDTITFFVGRKYGKRILRSSAVQRIFSQTRQLKIQSFLSQNSRKFVFGIRFFPGMRSLIFLTAGSMQIEPRIFFTMNALSTCIYVPLLVSVSFFASNQVQEVADRFQSYKWVGFITVATILMTVIKAVNRRIWAEETQEMNTKAHLDINTKFTLGDRLTPEQKAFYDEYGFVHFKKAFDEQTIQRMRDEIKAAADQLVEKQVTRINGVPIKFGTDRDGKMISQRTPFMNTLSPFVNEIVTSDRLKPLLEFIPGSRFGLNERDGVVINHYVNGKKSRFKKLGWHNDSIRDIFYLEKVRPMLNVGIALFPSSKTLGGLRVLPGTHNKGLLNTLFGKLHILDNRPDPNELAVEVEPGDLTIHDGRMWHRAESPSQKLSFERKSLYFPILCGPYKPKDANSKPPAYLLLMRGIKFPNKNV